MEQDKILGTSEEERLKKILVEKCLEKISDIFVCGGVFIYNKQDRDVLDTVSDDPDFIDGLIRITEEFDVDYKSYGQFLSIYDDYEDSRKTPQTENLKKILWSKRTYAPNPPLKPIPHWLLGVIFLVIWRFIYMEDISLLMAAVPSAVTICMWFLLRWFYRRHRISASIFYATVVMTIPMFFYTKAANTDGAALYYMILVLVCIVSGIYALRSKIIHKRIHIHMADAGGSRRKFHKKTFEK